MAFRLLKSNGPTCGHEEANENQVIKDNNSVNIGLHTVAAREPNDQNLIPDNSTFPEIPGWKNTGSTESMQLPLEDIDLDDLLQHAPIVHLPENNLTTAISQNSPNPYALTGSPIPKVLTYQPSRETCSTINLEDISYETRQEETYLLDPLSPIQDKETRASNGDNEMSGPESCQPIDTATSKLPASSCHVNLNDIEPDEFWQTHVNVIPDESEFDAKKRSFSPRELRPQPMLKKSVKVFVPHDLKDDNYWIRRTKNNIAAKRSRIARRIKENQIVMRACFLEKEIGIIQDKINFFSQQNEEMRNKLAKYTSKNNSNNP